jgi:hypothetical protein
MDKSEHLFLEEYEDSNWQIPEQVTQKAKSKIDTRQLIKPEKLLENNDSQVKVYISYSSYEPNLTVLKKIWNHTSAGKTNPILLVNLYFSKAGEEQAVYCGFNEENQFIRKINKDYLEIILSQILNESNRLISEQLIYTSFTDSDDNILGIENQNIYSNNYLFTLKDDSKVSHKSDFLKSINYESELLNELGFEEDKVNNQYSILKNKASKNKLALYIELSNEQYFNFKDKEFNNYSPVEIGFSLLEKEHLNYLLIRRDYQIYLYFRKSDPNCFLSFNLDILKRFDFGLFFYLLSSQSMFDGGNLEVIGEQSKDLTLKLEESLKNKIYDEVLPPLINGIKNSKYTQDDQLSKRELEEIHSVSFLVLFRLLFIAYGEDRGLLPYNTNEIYKKNSLKALAKNIAELVEDILFPFDEESTSFWDYFINLSNYIYTGNTSWGVLSYKNEIFQKEPFKFSTEKVDLTKFRLTNNYFGPVLKAFLLDSVEKKKYGPIDFRSLSIKQLGSIYEGLLESNLSQAKTNLSIEKQKKEEIYIESTEADEVFVQKNKLYFESKSGSRKSTGSYYTPEFLVKDLCTSALANSLDLHLEELDDSNDEDIDFEQLFQFYCIDSAMGSGHFLINVADEITNKFFEYITSKSALKDKFINHYDLNGDSSHLIKINIKKLVIENCIYGCDIQPVAVQLGKLALNLDSYFAGMKALDIDDNFVYGDSLLGFSNYKEIEEILKKTNQFVSEITLLSSNTIDWLFLFKLGETSEVNSDHINNKFSNDEIAIIDNFNNTYKTIHFPKVFNRVFETKGGFDLVVGNPPWDKVKADKQVLATRLFPGVRSLKKAEYINFIDTLEENYPDDYKNYVIESEIQNRLRNYYIKSDFPGLTKGDVDLSNLFSWKNISITKDKGNISLVLPGQNFSSQGMGEWRKEIFKYGSKTKIKLFINNKRWIFSSVHPQYLIGTLSTNYDQQQSLDLPIEIYGPISSLESLQSENLEKVKIKSSQLLSWSEDATIPTINNQKSLDIFSKIKSKNNILKTDKWELFVSRELDTTLDKLLWVSEENKSNLTNPIPVVRGKSFNLWEPSNEDYDEWADLEKLQKHLQNKRLSKTSLFNSLPKNLLEDIDTLPLLNPRIGFRLITNKTDTRTCIVSILPGKRVLLNSIQYIFFKKGGKVAEGFILGVMSSFIFDWQLRQVIETNFNKFIFNNLTVPDVSDEIYEEISKISLTLSFKNKFLQPWLNDYKQFIYEDKLDSSTDHDFKCRLEALVAKGYGLNEDEIKYIFLNFHPTSDHTNMLKDIIKHYREL